MYDAVRVDVFECVEHAQGDVNGAFLSDAAFIENFAQQTAVAPLHDHVNAGAGFTAKYAHDLGMVELFANGGFALKAVEEDGVGFEVRVWNLKGDGAVVAGVDGAVDRGHTAAGHRSFDAVPVDLRAGFKAVVIAHRAITPFRELI